MNETLASWRTWPNLVTAVRLALLPVFLWLLFGTGHRALAAWLLAVLGGTDWVDGYLARRFGQVSELGKILDPVADRLLVITGLIAVAQAHGAPWWFAGLTLAREIIVSTLTVALAALGAARIDVLWWGKVSTFALMGAYPLFLLTTQNAGVTPFGWQHDIRLLAWGFGAVGLTLSWLVLAGYVRPALDALRRGRAGRATR